MQASIERLEFLCKKIPQLLGGIEESSFSLKLNPEKWSKKQIIGHLIDSATNNHHRFVRGQFETIPTIVYNQVEWNKNNYYQQMKSSQIIDFWSAYNKQILELIKQIPKEKLNYKVNTGGDNSATIHFLFNDYVKHLEHHLKQVVSY